MKVHKNFDFRFNFPPFLWCFFDLLLFLLQILTPQSMAVTRSKTSGCPETPNEQFSKILNFLKILGWPLPPWPPRFLRPCTHYTFHRKKTLQIQQWWQTKLKVVKNRMSMRTVCMGFYNCFVTAYPQDRLLRRLIQVLKHLESEVRQQSTN